MPEPAARSMRSGRRGARLGLCCLALLCLGVGLAQAAAPRIGVLTMGPGDEYWARYGHNALLVEAPDGERIVYNYGFFDFEQPGFLLRFVRGQMRYQLVALPFDRDLAYYQSEGRGVRLQWLRLSADEAEELARFLAWNAQPENAEYGYDYFLDNCSTRVRDAVDQVLGGSLLAQTRGRSRGLSYRSEALRLAAPESWMYLGIHLLMGPGADRPLSRWEEGFVPARLHDALNLVQRADGRPLVESDLRLLPQRLPEARAEEPRFAFAAAAIGAGGGLLVLLLAHRRGWAGRFGRGLLAAFWLLCGLVGLLGLGLWALTDHDMASANRSLLLFNPLALGLLPALGLLARGDRPREWQRHLTTLIALLALITLPLYLLPVRPQDHLEWILLALPMHLAAWQRLRSASASTGD